MVRTHPGGISSVTFNQYHFFFLKPLTICSRIQRPEENSLLGHDASPSSHSRSFCTGLFFQTGPTVCPRCPVEPAEDVLVKMPSTISLKCHAVTHLSSLGACLINAPRRQILCATCKCSKHTWTNPLIT